MMNSLFPELELKPGDCINGKGKRLFYKDIYAGLIFVQQHSNIFLICKVNKIGEQVVYSDGGYEKNYTRKEYIMTVKASSRVCFMKCRKISRK